MEYWKALQQAGEPMNSKGRIIFVILDGGADRAQPSLGGLTPIEAARTPLFDDFARRGSQGQISLLPYLPQVPDLPGPTSDQAHLMLLGQTTHYSNRGEYMAWGVGLSPKGGDLCCRAYVKARIGETVIRFSPTLSRETAQFLESECQRINCTTNASNGVSVTLRFDPDSSEPRWGALLFSSNEELGQNITVPEHLPKLEYFSHDSRVFEAICTRSAHLVPLPSNETEILGQIRAVIETDVASQTSASLLRAFVSTSLAHFKYNVCFASQFCFPVGMIQPTEPGVATGTQPRFGGQWTHYLRSAAFTEKIEVHGVMRALGFDVARRCRRLLTEGQEVLAAAEECGFIFLQFKETDDRSHDNDPHGKLRVIEAVDTYLAALYERFPDAQFVVTADHTTPCGLQERIHTREPVPVVISGPGIPADNTKHFGERYARDGALGLICGEKFLSVVGQLCGNPIRALRENPETFT